MKIKTLIISMMLILSNIAFSQLKYDYYQITSQYPVSYIQDMSFIDLNSGFLSALKYVYNGNNYVNDINYLFKTTNGGMNWTKVWENTYEINSNKISVSFLNANTGYISKRTELKKTTDGGQTWSSVSTSGLSNSSDNLICTRSNGDVFLSQFLWMIYKYSNSNGFELMKDFGSNYSIKYFEISKFNDNNIYVCGYHRFQNIRPFFAKSTNAGLNWEFTIDQDNDIYGVYFDHMSVTNDGYNDVVKIGGDSKLIEYRNNQINILNNNWSRKNILSFGDSNNGYYVKYDGGGNEPPEDLGLASAYKTSDGGQTWILDLDISQGGHFLNTSYRFFSKGNIVYLTESTPTIFSKFYIRNLSQNIFTYHDNISTTGSFKINNALNNTPNTRYFRGGNYTLWTEPIINQNQSEEKIFYGWTFGKMNNSANYDLFYEGTIGTNYKTKQKSTEETAISNVNQTKAIRGSNGSTYQIHSSMGGIFYTLSSSPNAEFQSEAIVNGGQTYAQLPNSNTADNNKNPSINEIKYFDVEKNLPVSFVMSSVWERWDQQAGKTDILCALSDGSAISPWTRFGNNLSALDGKITTINNTTSGFNSKPDIYSIHISGVRDDVRNYLIIVPHLEPTPNGNKLITSVRYQNSQGYDYEALRLGDPEGYEINDFKIVSDNVTDYSVAYKPIMFNNQKAVYLYFTYKKNGKIYYERDLIYFDSGYNQIIREEIPIEEREYEVSYGDLQILRNTPDITLRNGIPTITYQGKNDVYRIINIDGSTGIQNIQLHYYPIFIKMREATGNWLSYYYNSNGFQTQENPDIEGSTDYDAFVINFSKAGNTFYQFVKINGLSGYNCIPGSFTGKDAKLIKGSYTGQFGTNSKPGLLTLSNQTNLLYNIGKQSFIISNEATQTDGFNNLDGTIIKDGINYSMTLGPIIASNTTFGFEDDVPPQTVHNPVEFNETMKSAVFSLSNGDTLILGSHGKYSYESSNTFHPLKFHVSLINSETGIIHRELFSDTIAIEDTVGLEFYRGFVIDRIEKGTENFYVQLFADTTNITDADYEMSASYADAQEQAQENGKTLKSGGIKIFFEKPKVNLNPVNSIPKNFELSQNYPNPFNPTTKINYALPKSGLVTLKIYDLLGREIITLINEYKQAGNYTVSFNAMNLASGIYLYKIQSGDFVDVKKMTLIK